MDKKSDTGKEREPSPEKMGEGHGRREELGSTVEEPFGVEETACIKSTVRNWRSPTLHNGSCKVAAYKLKW
jgi:hypothetical protein